MNNNNLLFDVVLRKRNQRKNAQESQINTSNGIVEEKFLEIGGIHQWVTIRGEDRNHPALLFIHGGPGSTYSIFSPLLRSWEQYFTIIQWDQRGAGKTLRKNGKSSSGSLSFARLVQDGIELAEFLCSKLDQQKLILVGSSVGSLIGTLMAKHRPDLFYAYVGTDQNSPDPHHISYRLALDKLRAAGDVKGAKLIEQMGPVWSHWSRKDFSRRNQLIIKAMRDVPNMIRDLILPSMLSSPDHKMRDIIDIFKGMNFSLDHLFDELMTFDWNELGTRFELPFFIFQGDEDIMTPAVTARAYFEEIEAPHKEFVLINKAGHLACCARPAQFLEELRKRVRPLAVTSDHLL